jgi:hypothetical protein
LVVVFRVEEYAISHDDCGTARGAAPVWKTRL